MPILHKVGRKDLSVRLLVGFIYLFLIGGAVTMLYPFGLMIGGSTKSSVDQKELRVIPGFMLDDVKLYRKYVEGLFNERLIVTKMAYDEEIASFEMIEPPATVRDRLVDEYETFLATTRDDVHAYSPGFMNRETTSELIPQILRWFVRGLKKEFDGDLDAANRVLRTSFATWQAVYLLPQITLERRQRISEEPILHRLWDIQRDLPYHLRFDFSVEGFYRNEFLKPQYTRDIEAYNEAHGTRHASYHEVRLWRHAPPDDAPDREDWERFVRVALNLYWIRADDSALPSYRAFLVGKYGTIKALNRVYGTSYEAFDDVPLVDDPLQQDIAQADWTSFLRGWKDPATGTAYEMPLDSIRIDCLDFRFRDFLRAKYPTMDVLNQALDTDFAAIHEIPMPQKELHYRAFLENRGPLRVEFLTRNYRTVISYLLLNGRALWNTVVYCGLAILSALIVNPMAAYALSRYQLPSTYKVLLFLMVTMAFPPMVTQIPVFLMLRNLNLLNTFWALILPSMANGYLIFILKGFFDSQPRELYECASLDGANEWVLFWQLTMNLSKPVLAYIALMAFTYAYSNFMFALLICQDRDMWTLMPTLYQLQLNAHMGITFASLIIAALPTFLVFLFAQNIIMRGIVVPVEK